MNSNRILTIVFLLVAIGLAWYLVDSIATSINTEKRIASQEQKIIDQLKLIRQAETAFLSVNGQYTSDWDKLINFVDSGRFYIVDKREIVISLDYGADSIYVELDTLGTVFVKDSLFSKLPNFDLSRLPFVPDDKDNAKFEVRADKITKSGVLVDVIEVWNPKPIDPRRDEESEYTTRKPLRFGSQTTVTVAGNWE